MATKDSAPAFIDEDSTGDEIQAQEALNLLNTAFEIGSSIEMTGNEVDLSDVESFEDLEDVATLTEDWELLSGADLVGVPFVVVGVNVNETSLGVEGRYFNIRCITLGDNRRVCFNDGGTGAYRQLKAVLAKMQAAGKTQPILVKGGLRASTFHYSEKEGKVIKGLAPNTATYFLSGSLKASAKSKLALAAIGVQTN